MEFWIDLLSRLALVVLMTFVATFGWMFAARRLQHLDKPFRSDMTFAVIRPWPPLWWLMTAFLGLVVIGGAVSSFAMDAPIGVLIMLAICAGLGVLVWMSLLMCLPISWIRWTEHGLEGPTAAYSTSRRELGWSEITRIERSSAGSFVENAQGQRVVWGDFHIGTRFLWGYLIHKRPDLKQQLDALSAANG